MVLYDAPSMWSMFDVRRLVSSVVFVARKAIISLSSSSNLSSMWLVCFANLDERDRAVEVGSANAYSEFVAQLHVIHRCQAATPTPHCKPSHDACLSFGITIYKQLLSIMPYFLVCLQAVLNLLCHSFCLGQPPACLWVLHLQASQCCIALQ